MATDPQNAGSDFVSLFDKDPELIYLNSGTHSLCPREVTDAVVAHTRSYELNPTGGLIDIWGALWSVQQRLASYLNARPQDLLLRQNVTAAMNTFILHIPLPEGPGEILLSDCEYGAIRNICRFRAEQDGLTLRSFHLPGRPSELMGLTEESLVSAVLRELKPQTRMVVLSHVVTGSGLRLPIERIAAQTRARGILLVVDGAHAAGALDLDFSRFGDVDFYGSNLHKWFMGPKGTGFAWVHPLHQSQLEPAEAGWMTFEAAPPYHRFAPGHRFTQRHSIAASIDFSPFFAIGAALDFWLKLGPDSIRKRIRALQACALREIGPKTGWPCLTPADPGLRGPLLSFELPQKLEAMGDGLMLKILREHRLQVASSRMQERWVLRVAPHIWNTEDEIARAAGILAGLA